MNTIHLFKVDGIAGGTIDFAAFAGKKILVVNVASECGLTPQYQQLQELYEEFEDKIAIVGFPANNFGAQEPGSNHEIQAFCSRNYGVTFPLASKVDVITHPVYQWLTQQALNGVQDSKVTWNFQKYALDEQGRLVHVFPPAVSPLDEEIIGWVSE